MKNWPSSPSWFISHGLGPVMAYTPLMIWSPGCMAWTTMSFACCLMVSLRMATGPPFRSSSIPGIGHFVRCRTVWATTLPSRQFARERFDHSDHTRRAVDHEIRALGQSGDLIGGTAHLHAGDALLAQRLDRVVRREVP